MKTSNKKSGYSLVEMLIYVFILSIVSFLVVHTLLSFTQSYRDLGALRAAEHSGIDAMERMTRDIRGGSVIDTTNSTFSTSPGVLTVISTINSISTTTKFYVQNGILKVDVNGSYSGPISLSNALITSLTFAHLNSGVREGVKVDITVFGSVGGVTKTRIYHSTILLRGK